MSDEETKKLAQRVRDLEQEVRDLQARPIPPPKPIPVETTTIRHVFFLGKWR